MTLEQELRRALKRKDPPSGFDDRVLARIAKGESVDIATARRAWARVSLPIAASVLLAFGATYYLQQQEQRQQRENQAQTEQAARDVVLALQIASETISAAQARVQEITRHEPTNDY
jgi:uncharacterized protein HemX